MAPAPPTPNLPLPVPESGKLHSQSVETPGRMIVVGWLIAHRLPQEDAAAVAQARGQMLDILRQQFREFVWYMPFVQRYESLQSTLEEPITLLDEGVQERDIQRWDYVFVITQANLRSYYKPYALGTPSRAISVAVLSTARLAPSYFPAVSDNEERVVSLARRICALGLHLLGDLNGLPHTDDPQTFMYIPEASEDLDRMSHYTPSEHEQLRQELSDAADLRLEERPETIRGGIALFYLKALKSWRSCRKESVTKQLL
jgi:predicted Zn-dependent protease